MNHIPVMSFEMSQFLITKLDGLYVDCTFGSGSHTMYLLNKFKNIKIVAFDWDEYSLNYFLSNEKQFNNRVIFIRDNFKNISKNLEKINIKNVDGIIADIGTSFNHFNDLTRGFSFNSNILDMRMDRRNNLTAAEIVNNYSFEDLVQIFYKYGEEEKSKQIAIAIVKYRKNKHINSAIELQSIVSSVKKNRRKTNPSTKVFQAIRIFINKELENLDILLSFAPKLLNFGSRIVVISFHSLEDRIVKLNFKQNFKNGIYKILTKKIIKPSKEEICKNFRSRSARMRVAEKI
jgi:16S rRNA (cytosine1402-N4)-methyltransferase